MRVLSTAGDVQYRGGVMNTVGDILSTTEDVQFRGAYYDKCEGYFEFIGGVHDHWRIS